MKVKNGIFFGISLLLIVPLGYFLFDRVQFVSSAQRVHGVVDHVTARNERCGRKRSRHNCTKFRAILTYEVHSRQYQIEVSAGSSRGHNQPTSYADYGIGQLERVAFDPRDPSRAYRDKLWDIWGAPIATFFIQIATFVASLNERRKDKRF